MKKEKPNLHAPNPQRQWRPKDPTMICFLSGFLFSYDPSYSYPPKTPNPLADSPSLPRTPFSPLPPPIDLTATTIRRVKSTFSTVIDRLSRRFSTSTNPAVDSNDPCMCLRTFLQTKSSFINCQMTCSSATGNPKATSRSTSRPCRPTSANAGSGNYSR